MRVNDPHPAANLETGAAGREPRRETLRAILLNELLADILKNVVRCKKHIVGD